MDNLTEIKIFDVLAGTDIKDAIEEAIIIAETKKCVVEFDFNGVRMKIYDFSDRQMMIDYYGRRLKEREIK